MYFFLHNYFLKASGESTPCFRPPQLVPEALPVSCVTPPSPPLSSLSCFRHFGSKSCSSRSPTQPPSGTQTLREGWRHSQPRSGEHRGGIFGTKKVSEETSPPGVEEGSGGVLLEHSSLGPPGFAVRVAWPRSRSEVRQGPGQLSLTSVTHDLTALSCLCQWIWYKIESSHQKCLCRAGVCGYLHGGISKMVCQETWLWFLQLTADSETVTALRPSCSNSLYPPGLCEAQDGRNCITKGGKNVLLRINEFTFAQKF